ncbi:unnamed protein product [Ambrosiozyma monospora]|uniref:Unnamed protein product n=1 Tax=Ambrosiozyma monospora TaxID=43982 RepID=A0ACB5U1N6_AMBMO|nr:unnamed protein product [Ambrosiozyma monospora]
MDSIKKALESMVNTKYHKLNNPDQDSSNTTITGDSNDNDNNSIAQEQQQLRQNKKLRNKKFVKYIIIALLCIAFFIIAFTTFPYQIDENASSNDNKAVDGETHRSLNKPTYGDKHFVSGVITTTTAQYTRSLNKPTYGDKHFVSGVITTTTSQHTPTSTLGSNGVDTATIMETATSDVLMDLGSNVSLSNSSLHDQESNNVSPDAVGVSQIPNVKDPSALNANELAKGYKLVAIQDDSLTTGSISATLELIDEPTDIYGYDFKSLKLKVEYQNYNRLNLRIEPLDLSNTYIVPDDLLNRPQKDITNGSFELASSKLIFRFR